MTLAKQINKSKQKDNNDRSCPCFYHKITFYYVRKAQPISPALRLSLSLTIEFAHTEPIIPIRGIRKLHRAPETPRAPLALKDVLIFVLF